MTYPMLRTGKLSFAKILSCWVKQICCLKPFSAFCFKVSFKISKCLIFTPVFLTLSFLQQTAHATDNGMPAESIIAATANSLGDLFVSIQAPAPGSNSDNNSTMSQVGTLRHALLEDARSQLTPHLSIESNTVSASSVVPLFDLRGLRASEGANEAAGEEQGPKASILYTANTHATALRYMPLANANADADANPGSNTTKYQGALYIAANQPDALNPGLTNLHRLALSNDQGQWLLDEQHSAELDLSPIDGLFNVDELLTSHWETLLAVESIPLIATNFWNAPEVTPTKTSHTDDFAQIRASAAAVNQYLNRDSNPYRYGYVVELVDRPLKAAGTKPEIIRHYATGRLPAGKTMLAADSRTLYRVASESGLLFRFVSDFPNNLAAGTLSVGRFVPIQPQAGNPYAFSAFNLQWVELGHANNEEIAGWIVDYEGLSTYDFTEGQTSYLSDEDVAAWFGNHKRRHLNDNGDINQYIDSRVAFLEPLKAVTAIGADRQAIKIRDITLAGNHVVLRVAADNINECGEIYAGVSDIEGELNYIKRAPADPASTQLCGTEFVLSMNERFLPSASSIYVSDGQSIERMQLPLADN